jgi:putative transposase
MEVFKSYRIPVEAPRDLIDEYFMKHRVLDGSRKQNRKLSKWSARTLQSMLEYKLKWLELPVKYVDAKNTSKTCPLCSGYLVAHGGRLMKCKKCSLTMDRDIVAALNPQMRGAGPPKSPQ